MPCESDPGIDRLQPTWAERVAALGRADAERDRIRKLLGSQQMQYDPKLNVWRCVEPVRICPPRSLPEALARDLIVSDFERRRLQLQG